jgi:molecular chaperone GrpE
MTKKKHEHRDEDDPQGRDEILTEADHETIALLKNQLAEYKEQLLRLAAEFDNYRKRSRADAQLTAWQQKRDLILGLLPVHDNLERAMAAIKDETVLEGLHMIANQFMNAMQAAGLTLIAVEVGTEFDPELQEAMVNVATNEMESGCVALVVERGYLLDGKLLRPTRVGVSCEVPKSGKGGEQ